MITRKFYKGFHLCLLLWLAGLIQPVWSSSINPTSSGTSHLLLDGGNIDALTISAPNEQGISINQFSSFEVQTRPLRLINVPGVASDDALIPAASLIVIIADDLVLKNAITLTGPAADILFVTNNATGQIECNQCVLNNFLRVTLAAAEGNSLTNNTSAVGELTAGISSQVSLNQVFAPGVIGFDVLAQNIQLNGLIDTHTRALTDARGGYTTVAHGDKTIGAGQVSLMLGNLTWDYDAHQLKSVAYSGTHTLNGTIHSSAIKITASGDLVLNTRHDTRTDLISAVSYKGGTHVPEEGIEVRTFAEGNLHVSGEQQSGGFIKLASHQDLSLAQSMTLNSQNVELIAKGGLTNQSTITAPQIQLAADSVVNEGRLEGSYQVQVWAEQLLANQYGAYITGDKVKLVSNSGVVRNGSRTPYRSPEDEAEGLLSLLQNSYVAALEANKLGIYYSLNHDPAQASGVSMAEQNTAHIAARSLEIQAVGFENINPYYKMVQDEEWLELSRDRINQVRVSAEDYLAIKASSYIANASAQIHQNDPAGEFKLETALFTNERYRIETELVYDTDHSYEFYHGMGYGGEHIEEDFEFLFARTVVYSPPGSIMAMGALEAAATQSFLNNVAYIEIFNHAQVDTPYIKDFGFENQALKRTDTVRTTNYTRQGQGRYYSSATQNVDPQELDSLFYVHGNFIASAEGLENDADALFANHNGLDHFIQQTIDMIAEDDFSHLGIAETSVIYYQEVENGPGVETTQIIIADSEKVTADIESAKENDVLAINWSEEALHFNAQGTGLEREVTLEGTENYGLFDKLKEYYDRFADSLSNVIDEIVWW